MAFTQLTQVAAVDLNQIRLTNNEATTLVPGTPVYVNAASGVKKAKADSATTTPTLGLALGSITAAAQGVIQLGGYITLTTAEWDAICGTSGGLSFNVPYYLSSSTAGRLTATPPSTTGDTIQQVIVAMSTTTAKISIGIPEVIGSGANLIRLTNNNAGTMIIGSPVYANAAAGMDLGIANGTSKSTIIGLVADATIASAATGNVAVAGVLSATTAEWDAVAGTVGGLVFNTPYYLSPSTAGRLTATAPTTPGQEVVQVIVALSTTKARIAIQPPVLL